VSKLSTDDMATLVRLIHLLDDEADTRRASQAFNDNRETRIARRKRQLHVGMRVEWTDKFGFKKTGVVERIKSVNVEVLQDGGGPGPRRWNVTASLLQEATNAETQP
jgi:hypothetical protein